eukprot:TRINITY_DN210_c1_g1_i1.p3 TRINITY_DN210_c1_g1~~TRINITY_DN210_c1_g1_i1.p3  ORF type:complete len:87 (-),score=21.35 TRINITY_DN210_c1_g1_i1:20-280(-)
MTWDDELVEEAVRAVGEEGTVEEAIEWLTKVIPCPMPMCRDEPLDTDKFEDIQGRLEKIVDDIEGLEPEDIDELAELAPSRWSRGA